MAKKTRKAVKKLAKTVEELQERNEEFYQDLTAQITEAFERGAESNRVMLQRLEHRLDALEQARKPEAGDSEGEGAGIESPQAEPVLAEEEDVPEDLEVTEAAQQKAEELGVNLENVEGTGSEGRILVKDVEEAARED